MSLNSTDPAEVEAALREKLANDPLYNALPPLIKPIAILQSAELGAGLTAFIRAQHSKNKPADRRPNGQTSP